MDITPIVNRELLTATRKSGLWWSRGVSAAILLAIALATFGARYYWDQGQVSDHHMMARVAFQAFEWMLVAQTGAIFGVFASRAALSIAFEKDRRTLDFLLATRLSNAEIVLGKLLACMTFLIAEFSVGLPIMLLLNPLGAIDLRLIFLGYAGLLTTGFFTIALAIWASARVANARDAVAVALVWWILWLIGPFVVSMTFTRVGIRLPGFLLTANAWVLTSSPLSLLFKIGGGVTPSSGLIEAVAWMGGLQVAGGALLIAWTIASLRSAYRRNVSGESQSLAARLSRPGWRWRPKPPVGDDPILWREMNLARSGLVGYAIGLVIGLAFMGVLGYATYFFARPAVLEVWRHGYRSGITSAERPEWNLMIRFFISDYGVNPPADIARVEFNAYLRQITTTLILIVSLGAVGVATEGIAGERARETWDSLIATPLSARDILRSKMLASLWRMRGLLAIMLGLWLIGLGAGAIHPFGFLLSLLDLTALVWCVLTFGTFISVSVKDKATTTGATMGLALFFTCSGALPLLLPGRWNSVVLGAGSPPFVSFVSLMSYRDVRNAGRYPVFPLLQWMNIPTGEGPLQVVATCLIGILILTAAGFYFWHSSVTQFDRLIGRPWKDSRARECTGRGDLIGTSSVSQGIDLARTLIS